MIKYDVIFWDFDGVICDSVNVKTQAFAAMFAKYGKEIEQKVVEFHLQNGGVSRFEKFKHFYTNFLNKPVNDEIVKELADEFSQIVFKKVIEAPFIDGAIESLDLGLKQGVNMYVISGTPEDEIRKIVETKGLSKYFIDVKGSPKKKIELAGEILNKNSYKKCLFIGDALSDLNCARHFNMDFLAIAIDETQTPFSTDIKTHKKVCLI